MVWRAPSPLPPALPGSCVSSSTFPPGIALPVQDVSAFSCTQTLQTAFRCVLSKKIPPPFQTRWKSSCPSEMTASSSATTEHETGALKKQKVITPKPDMVTRYGAEHPVAAGEQRCTKPVSSSGETEWLPGAALSEVRPRAVAVPFRIPFQAKVNNGADHKSRACKVAKGNK